MATPAMLIFTGKSIETTLSVGGTQSWVLDRTRARQAAFAVLCRNTGADWSEGDEEHGEGFMVGRVKDIVESTETPGRFLVLFDEYAKISTPNLWPGLRNPVHYTTLEEIGVDVSALTFEPMPPTDTRSARERVPASPKGIEPLTIPEAKARLAQTFGVTPDTIEITIRG